MATGGNSGNETIIPPTEFLPNDVTGGFEQPIPHYIPQRELVRTHAIRHKPANRGEGFRLKVLEEIKTALEHISNAKVEEDVMIRATEAHYLKDCLENLWQLRKDMENESKNLINLLYLNLKLITLERITNSQLTAYYQVLDEILRRTVKKDDFVMALKILKSGGVNVWAVLSGNPEED